VNGEGPAGGESAADRRQRLARAARAAAARIASAAAARAGRRGADPGPGASAPLRPGDLFVCPETSGFAVEWAVLERRAGVGARLYVVPADTNPLAGGADVAVPPAPGATGAGPLTLRCAHGAWVAADLFDAARRSGALDSAILELARAKRRWLERSGPRPTADTTDTDPEYEDWMTGNVAPARAALLRIGEGAGWEAARGRPPFAEALARNRYRVAASLLLGVALGLGTMALWQRYLLDGAMRGQRPAQAAPRLNVAVVWLAPREGLRSGAAEIRHLPATAAKIVFDLALDRRAPPAREYRLEIRRRDSGRTVWSTGGLLPNDRSEVTFELPRPLLPEGDYELLLSGAGGRRGSGQVPYSLAIGR
jgi:hypothetical protein